MAEIINKTDIELGVVATHSGWVGGIVPDDDGNAPRTSQHAARWVGPGRI